MTRVEQYRVCVGEKGLRDTWSQFRRVALDLNLVSNLFSGTQILFNTASLPFPRRATISLSVFKYLHDIDEGRGGRSINPLRTTRQITSTVKCKFLMLAVGRSNSDVSCPFQVEVHADCCIGICVSIVDPARNLRPL